MPKPPCLCTGRTDIRCDETHCDLAGVERHQCGVCWRYLTSDAHNRAWGGKGVRPAPPPCVHLGAPTGAEAFVPTCPRGTTGYRVPLLTCALFGTTTGRRGAPGQRSCHGCPAYQPDTFRHVAPAGTRDARLAWEGRAAQKPWHYAVTAVVPHLDTLEPLTACLDLLRLQTERPYLLVIDTGSPPALLPKVEALRAEDCEAHYVRAHGYLHSSEPVSVAQDLAFALCRSEYLYCTHADVFLNRRDYLARLLSLCSADCPAVGYEMSPRSWATQDWRGMVSHTATMLHMPTMRRLGVTWNMRVAYELAGWVGRAANGWPDTETGMNLILRRAGVRPLLLGPEHNYALYRDENLTHVRSYPGTRVYSPQDPYHARAARWMETALAEARARAREWRKTP
jgi:hypothetical protein